MSVIINMTNVNITQLKDTHEQVFEGSFILNNYRQSIYEYLNPIIPKEYSVKIGNPLSAANLDGSMFPYIAILNSTVAQTQPQQGLSFSMQKEEFYLRNNSIKEIEALNNILSAIREADEFIYKSNDLPNDIIVENSMVENYTLPVQESITIHNYTLKQGELDKMFDLVYTHLMFYLLKTGFYTKLINIRGQRSAEYVYEEFGSPIYGGEIILDLANDYRLIKVYRLLY